MKKALIIEEKFPNTGGTRTEKFTKFLPQFGWEPIILTISQIDQNPFAEEILKNYTSPTLKIYGTKTLPNFSVLKRFNLTRLAGILNSLFFIPDTNAAWMPYAIIEGLRIIRHEKPQIIYSTSPHEGVHLIAYLLKRKMQLPWVADFRDLWTLYQQRYRPPTFVHHLINSYLEKSIYLHWSDSIIANTEENRELLVKYFQINNSKIYVIPNGFDPEDISEITSPERKEETMILGYLGGVEKPAICFKEFLAGYEKAVTLEKRFSMKLWSVVSDRLKSTIIENSELRNHIVFSGYLSHQASMKELARVDILVVLLAGNYPHVVPQKLYNYLALKKPILAVVPPDGRAAQIIKETKSGIVVSPNDSDAIAEHLLELHKSWEKGSMEINIDKEKLAEYRRDLLTKKLATIFDRYMKY